MPHSDEPEYDGPGAGIYNFIILGQGLAALSSSFHKEEDWRVFEVNTGDVWWIADQFRFEWEHEVLRDMPTPVPVDFLDLSKQRIVVTVRMGETPPAQEARWEHIYSSSYVDVESTDKGKPSGGTAMLPANGGRLTRKWLSDHKRGDGDIGEDHVHTPRTTGPAAPRESATYATTATGRHPQSKWQLGDTLKQFKGHAAFQPFDSLSPTRSDITFTPGGAGRPTVVDHWHCLGGRHDHGQRARAPLRLHSAHSQRRRGASCTGCLVAGAIIVSRQNLPSCCHQRQTSQDHDEQAKRVVENA